MSVLKSSFFSCASAVTLCLSSALFAQDFNANPPNTPDFKPAFDGQTRAPIIDDKIKLDQRVVARGLAHPWGMAELPDGSWLVTERIGQLRLIQKDGKVSAPISGLPEIYADGQGGLLDIVVSGDFAKDRRLWFTFSQPREAGKNATAIASAVLSADGSSLTDVKVIFQQQPAWASKLHFGSRLAFAPDGMLFASMGERSVPEARVFAQDVSTHLGKILRLTPDGAPAPDNPKIAGGLPEIWSYGHRNPQAMAFDATGTLWEIEHGPRGGDELNQPKAGLNYGWPVITYGQEYSGKPIGAQVTQQDGMEQPVYYWDPVIAPSGMVFYDGDLFPDWKGSLLTGGLAGKALVRLTLDGEKVTGEARYLQGFARIRDVDVASDGAVMILTDAADGALIRLAPQN